MEPSFAASPATSAAPLQAGGESDLGSSTGSAGLEGYQANPLVATLLAVGAVGGGSVGATPPDGGALGDLVGGSATQASAALSFLASNVASWLPRGALFVRGLAGTATGSASSLAEAAVRRCASAPWLQSGALLALSALQAPCLLLAWLLVTGGAAVSRGVSELPQAPQCVRDALLSVAGKVAAKTSSQRSLQGLLPATTLLGDAGLAALPLALAYLLGAGYGSFATGLLLAPAVVADMLLTVAAGVLAKQLLEKEAST